MDESIRAYQFELRGRATLRPVSSGNVYHSDGEADSIDDSIVRSLNAEASSIAQEIEQEIQRNLSGQYGEAISVEVEIQFHRGTIHWDGVVNILQAMDLTSGVISFLQIATRVIQFAAKRIIQRQVQNKAGPGFSSSITTTVFPMTTTSPAGTAARVTAPAPPAQTTADLSLLTKIAMDLNLSLNRIEMSLRFHEAFMLAILLLLLASVVVFLMLAQHLI